MDTMNYDTLDYDNYLIRLNEEKRYKDDFINDERWR